MSLDLEERLAAYRPMLERAIDEREAEPSQEPAGRRRTWIVGVVAAAAVAASVIGVVAVRTAPTTGGTSPADGPPPEPPIDAPVPTTAPPPAPMGIPGPPPPAPSPTPAAPVAPTVSAVTAPPPPPTGTVAPPGRVIAIGDSVMLGAAANLAEQGILVDASQDRQVIATIELMEQLAANGVLGEAVVIHLGTNGPPSDETLDAFFTALAGVPKVVVLTAYADRSWIGETNANLTEAADRFANIQLVDWANLANQCPGDCFANDGIHINPAGREYYTQLIVDALAS